MSAAFRLVHGNTAVVNAVGLSFGMQSRNERAAIHQWMNRGSVCDAQLA